MVDEKEAALRRAELMAKEIDHRVMNSLRLVSGLLLLCCAMKKMNAADRTTQLSPLRSLTGRCAPLSRGVAQSLDADVVWGVLHGMACCVHRLWSKTTIRRKIRPLPPLPLFQFLKP